MIKSHGNPESELQANDDACNQVSSEEAQPDPSGLSGVWRVLTSQPGLGVMLVRPDGYVRYVNDSYVNDYFQIDVAQLVGKCIQDLFVSSVAGEIQAAIGRVAGTEIQLIRKVLFGGRQIQATYRWLEDEMGGPGNVLITLQRGFREPEERQNVEIEHAGYIDLGPLSVLTERELEVIALVGQGMRVKEIAETLHRSPKTIETHIGSMYRKIGTNDRAVLMRIAQDAGLDLEMTAQPRVDAIHLDRDRADDDQQTIG